MKTLKSPFEINWPLSCIGFFVRSTGCNKMQKTHTSDIIVGNDKNCHKKQNVCWKFDEIALIYTAKTS